MKVDLIYLIIKNKKERAGMCKQKVYGNVYVSYY